MNKNNIICFLLIACSNLLALAGITSHLPKNRDGICSGHSIAKAKHAEMEKASKAAAAKRQTNAKAKCLGSPNRPLLPFGTQRPG